MIKIHFRIDLMTVFLLEIHLNTIKRFSNSLELNFMRNGNSVMTNEIFTKKKNNKNSKTLKTRKFNQ